MKTERTKTRHPKTLKKAKNNSEHKRGDDKWYELFKNALQIKQHYSTGCNGIGKTNNNTPWNRTI